MLAAISSRFFEISSPNGLDVQYDSGGHRRLLSTVLFRDLRRDARPKGISAIVYLENWVSRCVVLVEEDRWLFVGRCTSNVQEQVV
jgi:hypothetical protein